MKLILPDFVIFVLPRRMACNILIISYILFSNDNQVIAEEEKDTVISDMAHVGTFIRAWRQSQKSSETALAQGAGITVHLLQELESEQCDPHVSVLEALATALKIPLPWIFILPSDVELLCKDDDEEPLALSTLRDTDPVLDKILMATGQDRTLYVLLTALLQSADPKLLRAAEVSLRSLVKQSKQATVPWLSRPPGHFEPPSD
jgi:transcriptional regulator with XRE-family HTH domain